ncbi:hypothetical protein DAPPUDRAFT_247279 [Daphnia pulex]|uniref:Uncharacterized protein n=1 Tax=Daphnia pulex TaxID=6669 RepID=E9GS54_DAPPU|nr:hypothetical protein DAPPUDRAFT_247279 [Daphnia pulex]|eukprot:EFX77652.1 hypothetical protein DAPPUDRAFT_247279 [Daphnia pulex]
MYRVGFLVQFELSMVFGVQWSCNHSVERCPEMDDQLLRLFSHSLFQWRRCPREGFARPLQATFSLDAARLKNAWWSLKASLLRHVTHV